MKVTILAIGKTEEAYLQQGEAIYLQRLKHYVPLEYKVLPALKKPKGLSKDQIKTEEGKLLMAQLQTSDHVVLLDELGKEYNSPRFADFLQKQMNAGHRNLVFIIGGPFGFSAEVYQRANGKVALSQMTFSHQMVRLFFVEQLYRGFSILRGEKYHH